ncbi:MAG: phosphoribosylamine--glycine ligase [Thermoflavifilum sp.]|nr:phosphoribosylamine--glycine ligase [Thermoflavifilum sp.]MCL6514807.1 phosphoribosylamine--glycine ligase [Alicyclobacillus sp.]
MPTAPRVLIVGGGGREHAIAWKLAQSPHRPRLWMAPGNAGMAALCERAEVTADDPGALARWAATEGMDLVVVGPEQPLADGLVDACLAAGVRAFGPTQAAAQLETSKAFAKYLMQHAGVPTAPFEVHEDAEAALDAVRRLGAPIVVKADGLAAGKGVIVAETVEEAEAAVRRLMVERRFGDAGARVVLERKLQGTELSQMFFVDAETVVAMPPARDHKRLLDGDRGPNTGGMGAFAPVEAAVEAGIPAQVEATIVRPTLRALREEGIIYRGVLYAGLMITADGPQVIEFNVRFGDPETQAILPLLRTDLLEVMWAVTDDQLAHLPVAWHSGAAACVVAAAEGYPDKPRTGHPIEVPGGTADSAAASEPIIFHAGTALRDGRLVTAGGRVLATAGTGDTLAQALSVAYETMRKVHFEGMHYRTDIGSTTGL